MGRPKNPLTLLLENYTAGIVDKIVAGELPQIDRIRQIWYTMKGYPDIIAYRPAPAKGKGKKWTDEEWEKYVSKFITQKVEALAENNLSLYDDLGLESKAFTPNNDEIPIILFTEKKVSVFDNIVNEYGMATYTSRGQLPIFEAYLMSKYLDNTIYNEAYMFVLTDRDPAGESIFENVKNKMHDFTTDTHMNIIHVMINEDEAEHFETYPLTDNILNADWINRGVLVGVEIDNLYNITDLPSILLDRIEAHLDPRLYVKKSRSRFINEETYTRIQADKKLQVWDKARGNLQSKIWYREEEITDEVRQLKTDFSYNNTDVLEFSTYIRNSENTDMTPTDLHFYNHLLGDYNPYQDDIQRVVS